MFKISKKGAVISACILLTTCLLGLLLERRLASATSQVAEIKTLPYQIASWSGFDTPGLGLRELDILKLSEFVTREYANKEEQKIALYIGYWEKQTSDHQAAKHSPSTCLPANGWKISEREAKVLTPESKPLKVSTIVADFKGKPYLFYYWFFSGETTYASESLALLNISLQSLIENRSDGGIIEFSMPLANSANRKKAVSDASVVIEGFLESLRVELDKVV